MTPRAIPVAGVKPDAGSYSHVAAAWGGLLFVSGAGLDALAKLTVYVTDAAHAADVARVRTELLEPPFPASSAVVAAGSLDPASKVEIEAIAVVAVR
jgi:enamine deaminase RidA (YjgF/YER057c/UK114 family)